MTYGRLTVAAAVVLGMAACQPAEETPAGGSVVRAADGTTAVARTTAESSDEEKIAEAMSAAPDSISRDAAVMDWPRSEGAEFRQLRAGTNNWVCFPSTPVGRPETNPDPMCLDQVFQQWADAWANRTNPRLTQIGFGYMLRGDVGASNTDPFAMDSTADNNWVRLGPHVMVVGPTAALANLPDTPGPAPWVMWKGTPYAHVMVPVR